MSENTKTINVKNEKPINYFDWLEQAPQWLKDAHTAVVEGNLQTALQLINENLIDQELQKLPKIDRSYTMYRAASLLRQSGDVKRAEDLLTEILKFNAHAAVYNELSDIYRNTGRTNEAIRSLKAAIDNCPDEPLLWGNLATNLLTIGQIDKAVELLHKVWHMRPENNLAASNLLLYMHYDPKLTRSAAFDVATKWAKQNVPQSMAKTSHTNTRDPNKKLKIGYISPDFRNHSVTYFFEPLLEAHDREKFEIYGYGNIYHYDEVTDRLKAKFDHYRNVRTLSNEAKAKQVEQDGIDILVDLAGHSGNCCIYSMAYKPAPIQVTWLGYPDTTGMTQIDYRLTDIIADPPGSEKYYSEKLFYLPDIFLCYGPCGIQLPIGPLPYLETKRITFGCFNNSTKINPLIIDLWSQILKNVPNSQMLLKFKSGQDDEIRDMFLTRFEEAGIAKDRIAISGWLQSPHDLNLYNKVDIALDTFPYNGTTTTCQSILMGVPVVSLVGEHHMSRVGLSILTNLGMEFFAAPTPQQYIARATALALKPESISKIRTTMRDRMRGSTLCNKAIFAARMEKAYRTMWQTWCNS
jgi:predicted O-linked N-acetylglucosamine transferase (SPINDLY family)